MNTVSVPLDGSQSSHRGLNAMLWVSQVALAVLFGMAGVMKTTAPLPDLARILAWTSVLPGPLVRFIGVSELAGAIGVLLPALLRIRPVLTPLAAIGLTAVMVLAAGFHLMRAEYGFLGMPLVLGALAAFTAWGRLQVVPIAARARR